MYVTPLSIELAKITDILVCFVQELWSTTLMFLLLGDTVNEIVFALIMKFRKNWSDRPSNQEDA